MEKFSELNTGVTKRCLASLIDDDELGGYLVVTNMVSPGRNLSLVDARRLQPGGHAHVQVCYYSYKYVHSMGAQAAFVYSFGSTVVVHVPSIIMRAS